MALRHLFWKLAFLVMTALQASTAMAQLDYVRGPKKADLLLFVHGITGGPDTWQSGAVSNPDTSLHYPPPSHAGAMSDPVSLSRRVSELARCSLADAERYIEVGWVRLDCKIVEYTQLMNPFRWGTLSVKSRTIWSPFTFMSTRTGTISSSVVPSSSVADSP